MKRKPLQTLAVYLLLLGGSAVFMLPLVWMVATAVKPIDQTMTVPPVWVPYQWYAQVDGQSLAVDRVGNDPLSPGSVIVVAEETGERMIVPEGAMTWRVAPRWENFHLAIEAMGSFWRYFGNTVLLAVLTVIGTVCSSAVAAYGFSRIDWPGRDKLFILALATMMVPFPVLMVPLYSLFRALGWIGTLQPLWVPTFFAIPFNVFLLRQFFRTIPADLSDAARIDGCGEFRIFFQVILPLARPALVVVAVLQFLATWNDFLGPLIFLTDQEDFTLALGLQAYQSRQGGTEWHYLMAASTLVVLPVVILFFVAQKALIEGISMTGLKG